ncbi:MAG: ABC transporter substrate-binding protein [Halohasta sp.]
MEITTLPSDSDPFAVRIANHLQSHLEAVGVDVQLTPENAGDLAQQVLLNHDFDIYVGQFPYTRPPDPDAFYPLFRSTFDSELGWQNPFGFTHLTCDDLLEAQRAAGGEERQQEVADLQRLLARTQPLTPIVAPDVLTGVRTDRFTGWDADDRSPSLDSPTHPYNLLQLEGVDDQPQPLRLVVVDDRIINNRNPISAAYRQESSLLDLVYDSVAFDTGEEYIPWLARELSWADGEGPPEVDIRLREGLLWHDGQQLSAFDVGFTYEFLQDTSRGRAVRPIPSERFRGRVSLVEEVIVRNAHELTLRFGETSQAVARRALTVPVLPAHIWRYREEVERPRTRAGRTTAALTTSNGSAIGSGPLRFEEADGDTIEFSLFEPHFLWRSRTPRSTDDATTDGPRNGSESSTGGSGSASNDSRSADENGSNGGDGGSGDADRRDGEADGPRLEAPEVPSDGRFAPPPEIYEGRPAFDSVTVRTVSSANAAVALLSAGDVDATATNLSPEAAASVAEESALERIEHRSNAFYHLGFNTRRQPLGNPNFRRLVAQLVDKPTLVEEAFEGYGVPAASPLAETDWVADSLRWDDGTDADPEVPFLGSDGELAVEEARERFRSIGYQYTEDNELVSQIR